MNAETLFASVLPGRIRLRHPVLRRRDLHAQVVERLQALAEVESNPALGSLLLRFDPEDAGMEARIRAEVAAIVPGAESPADETRSDAKADPARAAHHSRRRRRAKWELNRAVKIGSVASMALSLAALSASRKLHAQAGALAVALMLIHIVIHRRHVLR